MDLTSQNPKNKMHLAWKLVFTHLYMPDAIIIIYMTFQWYCRELEKGLTHRSFLFWQHNWNRNKDDRGLMFFSFSFATKQSSDLAETVTVSSYGHNCQDLLQLDVQNNKQTIYRWFRGEITEPTWELRLNMCWLKPFFLPTHNASWLTSLKKSSEVSISHIFSFLSFFFSFSLFYSSATSVQWWL